MISLRKTGAGEGIRTLDPNLGKVKISLRPTTLIRYTPLYNNDLDRNLYAQARPIHPLFAPNCLHSAYIFPQA